MIFVTVYTNPLGHDDLIETVDKIQSSLSEQIVMRLAMADINLLRRIFRFAPHYNLIKSQTL